MALSLKINSCFLCGVLWSLHDLNKQECWQVAWDATNYTKYEKRKENLQCVNNLERERKAFSVLITQLFKWNFVQDSFPVINQHSAMLPLLRTIQNLPPTKHQFQPVRFEVIELGGIFKGIIYLNHNNLDKKQHWVTVEAGNVSLSLCPGKRASWRVAASMSSLTGFVPLQNTHGGSRLSKKNLFSVFF